MSARRAYSIYVGHIRDAITNAIAFTAQMTYEEFLADVRTQYATVRAFEIIGEAAKMLLSTADRALGRLDGATETLPNPELFVYMYVHKEAVLSSQIEGTWAPGQHAASLYSSGCMNDPSSLSTWPRSSSA